MIKTDIETDYIPSAMNATAKNMHLHKWEVIQQDVQNNRSPWHGRMGINGSLICLRFLFLCNSTFFQIFSSVYYLQPHLALFYFVLIPISTSRVCCFSLCNSFFNLFALYNLHSPTGSCFSSISFARVGLISHTTDLFLQLGALRSQIHFCSSFCSP